MRSVLPALIALGLTAVARAQGPPPATVDFLGRSPQYAVSILGPNYRHQLYGDGIEKYSWSDRPYHWIIVEAKRGEVIGYTLGYYDLAGSGLSHQRYHDRIYDRNVSEFGPTAVDTFVEGRRMFVWFTGPLMQSLQLNALGHVEVSVYNRSAFSR